MSTFISTEQHDGASRLIDALRHLPDGFKWDYSRVCTCAMGLAAHIGLVAHPHEMVPSSHRELSPIGMSRWAAQEIFTLAGLDAGWQTNVLARRRPVTPEHVADLIETWLGRQRIRFPATMALPRILIDDDLSLPRDLQNEISVRSAYPDLDSAALAASSSSPVNTNVGTRTESLPLLTPSTAASERGRCSTRNPGGSLPDSLKWLMSASSATLAAPRPRSSISPMTACDEMPPISDSANATSGSSRRSSALSFLTFDSLTEAPWVDVSDSAYIVPQLADVNP